MPLAFLGGAIGPAELLVVMIAVLLLFGPKRLPEMARTLGAAMAKLYRAADEVRDQVIRADQTDEAQLSHGSSVAPAARPTPGQETPLADQTESVEADRENQQESYAG